METSMGKCSLCETSLYVCEPGPEDLKWAFIYLACVSQQELGSDCDQQ